MRILSRTAVDHVALLFRLLLPVLLLAAGLTQTAQATATAKTCTPAGTIDMTINYGDDVSCSIDPAAAIDFFRFQGTAGEKIQITVAASSNVGPCIALYDPASTKVSESCPWGSYVVSSDFTLAQTGLYTIRVWDNGYNNTWTFRLFLERWSPALAPSSIAYGQSLSGTLSQGEVVDQWVFTGGAGDSVAVQVSASSNVGPSFILYKPNGDVLDSKSPWGAYIARGEYILPTTGTYLLRVLDNGRDNAWSYSLFLQCLGTCTSNSPPTVTGVAPGAGATATQAFTFSVTDPNGWQDLSVVNVLVNFWLDGRNSCYLAYSRLGNTLYLMNNAGDGYAGSMPLNGSGTLGNSQCTINGVGSSVTGSGNTMTLTLNMTFPASFAGTRIVYLAARDSVENNSGWQRMGVWNVPGAAQTTTTAVAGMNPARGSGTGGTFTFTFTDTMGASDLGVMNVLVNDWLDGRHACYLAYARGNNTLYLVNDSGDGLLPGKVLNGTGSLGNSQCTVNGVGSSATPSGNTLTLTLNMTFGSGFVGNRVYYLAARDVTELNNTGWQAMGSWTAQ